MRTEQLELIVKGAIVGQLVGDAIGFLHKDKEPNQVDKLKSGQVDNFLIRDITSQDHNFYVPRPVPPLNYTAKGSLLIATAASLADAKTLDLENVLENFNEVYLGNKYCVNEQCEDIDLASVQAIKNHTNGMPHDRCAIKDLMYNDADCVGRVLPVALFYASEPLKTFVEAVHSFCNITHGHIRAHVTSALFALMVRNIYLQHSEKVSVTLGEFYLKQGLEEYQKELEEVLEARTEEKHSNGKLADSLWLAWEAFSENPEDFEQCIVGAVKNGGCANIIAGLAGTLCGLSNGLYSIPQRWVNAMTIPDDAMIAVEEFIDLLGL